MRNKEYDQLIIKAIPRLKYYCFKLCCNNEDAEDLIHSTLLSALSHPIDHDQNLGAYLHTIARNHFINEFRRVKQHRIFCKRYMSLTNQCHIDSPDLHNIEAAIQHLPRVIAGTFTMYLQGFKYQEIADELGVDLGTVKSRIFNSRKKLKMMLS